VPDARRRGCNEPRERSCSAGALQPPPSTRNTPRSKHPSPRVPDSPVEILDDTTDEDEAVKTLPLEEDPSGGRNASSAGATATAGTRRSSRLVPSTSSPLCQESLWSKLKGLKVYHRATSLEGLLSLPLAYFPARAAAAEVSVAVAAAAAAHTDASPPPPPTSLVLLVVLLPLLNSLLSTAEAPLRLSRPYFLLPRGSALEAST